MPEAHAARRKRLAARVAASGADAALITHRTNVRYLTGLASSNAALLVTSDADRPAILATDSRYALAADRACPDVELVTARDVTGVLAQRAAGSGLRRILFEAHAVTVAQYSALTTANAEIAFAPLGRAVEDLRMVKDEEEIDCDRDRVQAHVRGVRRGRGVDPPRHHGKAAGDRA